MVHLNKAEHSLEVPLGEAPATLLDIIMEQVWDLRQNIK